MILVIFTLNVDGALTKRVYRSYPVNKIQKLQVSSKYGHIFIDDNRKDSVVVDIKIWVEGDNERSQKLLDKINATINLEGNTVIAQTTVESFSNNFKEFNIDYRISIPSDKDLSVAQKYGTVVMKNLTGKGAINIGYGEFTAAKLLSPSLKMDISYSKANVEETGNLDLDLKYSKFFLDKGLDLNSTTRYSEFNVGEMKNINTDSKYDQYKIDHLNTLKMISMYTNTRIDRLNTKIDMENGYGNLRIENIPAGFESIRLMNKFATVKLGIASNASYKLDGKAKFCNFKHPQGNQLTSSSEINSYSVKGLIGNNADAKSTVTIESSFGNVNLVP
jgi:hypothetical protein